MLQLHNSTKFAASMALLPSAEAIDTLYVIVKASFNFGPQFTLADEQTPPLEQDVYWTEPGKSSLKYASDVHTGKPATDIVMLGHACAPGKKEATQVDVSLTVGKVHKTVCVYGDREWRDGRITNPAPFRTMPIVYEKAFGGVHIANGEIVADEPRNPIGRGFAGPRNANEMNGVPLPNLEDPASLIRAPEDQPVPASFACCPGHWLPRANYAGTYDDKWKKTRAPYLPDDFDSRFHNMAQPDLIYPGYLQGGEMVEITHMHPDGPFKFDLPELKLMAHVEIGQRAEDAPFNMETLILEPNQRKLSMVWRAALPCDKQMWRLGEIRIGMTR